MKFLENIKSSIYDPAYYKEMLNKPFSSSLRYFLSLMALVSLAATIYFSISALPVMNKVIGEIASKALNYYPDNLEVTIKNGKVSTNVQEPYYIKMPAELKDDGQDSKKKLEREAPENLMVIDTKSPLSIELFKSYKTAVLLGADSIAWREESAAMKIQSFENLDAVITKAKAVAAMDKITPYLKVLPYILLPIVFLGSFLGSVLGYLIYLIFGAAVIWLAFKIANKNLEYGKAYQVGLHAITFGVILEFTLFWFYPVLEIPFFFTFLLVVIAWMNLNFVSSAEVSSSERQQK